MAPASLAPKSRRVTRSLILKETTNIVGGIKQELNVIKVEVNEATAKQQSELNGGALENGTSLTSDSECFFDLSRVKIEPTDEFNVPVEDITVDLNTVKNEPNIENLYPYVVLNACLNRKIKTEPGSIQENAVTFPPVDLINVKKEEVHEVKYPYILLNDCMLSQIKFEPKSEVLTDPLASSVLTPVKKESQKNERSSNVENPNNDIKFEQRRKSKRTHLKVAYETENHDSTDKKMLRSSAPPKVKLEAFNGTRGKWEPPNWSEVIDNIRKMRKEQNAPIDLFGPYQWMSKGEDPKVSRYQTFVSMLLSSKTWDEVNYAAMTRLRKHGLTVERILETDEETIGKLIAPVSFWKSKSRYLLRSTTLLRQHHNDDVPNSVAKLVSLPGVGPKMAHICMSLIWGKTTGIGVGSFVHRVTNRLGWAHAYEPEKTELMLKSWMPRSFWPEVNQLIVGFGQQTCQARRPRCEDCLLAAKVMCPSAPLELYYHPA